MKAPPQKSEPAAEDRQPPVLDLSDAAVKELIRTAKQRGYVVHDQITALLAAEEVNSEQIETILAKFSEMGINVVETKDARPEEDKADDDDEEDDAESENALVEVGQQKVPAKSAAKEPAERTDDPVRMYLREMASMQLLSREGEVAIAKRIEAGREAMIAGLCESPLTFQAITIWQGELNDGKVLLRDIIDLDATYAGPDAKAVPASAATPDGQAIPTDAVPVRPEQPAWRRPPTPPASASADGGAMSEAGETGENGLDDDEDKENWFSIAAAEAELRPKIIESFDTIAANYKRLRRLQDQDIQFRLRRQSLSPAQERKYKGLKNEIVGEVKSLRLNRLRIDALTEQLYDINKRLVGYEGRLMRLAESHGVLREDFLRNYMGSELDPLWLNRMSKVTTNGWKSFVARDKDTIRELRTQIHELATETGLEIDEFRKILHAVQNGEREALRAKKEMVVRICASSSRLQKNTSIAAWRFSI